MKMKLHFLNPLIISLSILYKVSARIEDRSDCELALEWINDYNSRNISDCCVSDSDPIFSCNNRNKIESININSVYTDIPDFDTIPKLDDLTSLKIIDTDYPNGAYYFTYSLNSNILKLQNLKTIIVDSNYILDINFGRIDPNCPLEELILKNTQIQTLPDKLFKLNNFKKIELKNNTSLYVQIVKFKNSPIECNFENTDIECYQEGACINISTNNYRKCYQYEINRILRNETIEFPDNQPKSDNKDNLNSENENNSNGSNGILIGILIGICIMIILASVIIIKKLNKRNKLNNYIDFNLYKKKKQIKLNEEPNSTNNETLLLNNNNINTNNENQFQNNIVKKNDENHNTIKNAHPKTININLNPFSNVTKDFPIVDSSNYVGDNSVLPSYNQLEYSHAIQPLKNKNKKPTLNEKN